MQKICAILFLIAFAASACKPRDLNSETMSANSMESWMPKSCQQYINALNSDDDGQEAKTKRRELSQRCDTDSNIILKSKPQTYAGLPKACQDYMKIEGDTYAEKEQRRKLLAECEGGQGTTHTTKTYPEWMPKSCIALFQALESDSDTPAERARRRDLWNQCEAR